MSTDRRSAPLGIKIICGLAALGTVLGVLGGFGMMGMAADPATPGALGLVGLVVVGLSLLNVPLIYGLWTLKSWGWTLAMVLYGLNVVLQALSLLAGNVGALVGLPVTGIILWYVYSKRALYGKM